MCGILGSINVANTDKLLNTIVHRGPDAFGLRSYKVECHEVTFSHRRLSIIDLSVAGNQPMEAYDNGGCIIFNGEIYNHEDLKKELVGIAFKGHSDTETIANYFRVKDIEDNFHRLNGIFGIAYFDIKRQKIYLARDRYGVKPLYYHFLNNQLIFSSEIRPLKAYFNSQLDKAALLNSLRMRYTPSPLTAYQQIYKVEPGQLLIFDLSSTRLSMKKKYFVADKQKMGSREGDTKRLTNEYGDLFEKAVLRQLMGDVEVGILLSGGIDSALVAAIATHKSKIKLKAFTVGFDQKYEDMDEIAYASETASLLGLEHFYERINFNSFLQLFKQVVEVVEEPLGTTSIIPMFSLSRLAASKVKVVLSGQGADEPLGGYKKYKMLSWLEKLRSFHYFMNVTKLLEPLYNKYESVRRLLSAMQANNTVDSYLAFNAISSTDQVKKLISKDSSDFLMESCDKRNELFKKVLKRRTSADLPIKDRFLYYDLRTSLADDLLMYTDKITMHFSLECRVPILDNDLIEFIESLKSKYKFNSHNGKLIHKAFASEYLPSRIINRKKIGFQSPTAFWFRKNKFQIASVLLSSDRFLELFDKKAVGELLDAHENGDNFEKQIFLLLAIRYLIEQDHAQ